MNLWNEGFYIDVKKYILDRANGTNPGSKQGIQSKAERIHQGRDVPEELQTIINNL